ncbi:phosphoenolpyruvate--protein phosphotransferase [Singulisphaera sp. PoT]|uniref:phosphoenolpyruvate--protein phosphotransferase n=1 Tax=Singulisphaera sp. PoT TaxID=3411797 RepID=UPI003BF4EB30
MKAREPRTPKSRGGRGPSGQRQSPRPDASVRRKDDWESGTPPPPTSPAKTMQTLRGIAVSPGVAIGPPLVLDPRGQRMPSRTIDAESVSAELERLDQGLESARREVEQAEAEARDRIGAQYADILSAHARMISDLTLRRDARLLVERDRVAAEHAISEVLDVHAARLERLTDSHLAARAADVRDIQRRIIGKLSGLADASPLDVVSSPTAIFAHDLSPSETAALNPQFVLGFATEAGGRASHTAIVAAALEIPAVVGLGRFLDQVRESRMVIIDGDEGLVVLDPDPPTQERYRKAAAERLARFEGLVGLAKLPAETLDGEQLGLWGNIEFPVEGPACLERGAVGVGLYRTEFLYLNGSRPPTEEEQYEAYSAVVRSLEGRPVTIRTLDLGADKLTSYQTVGYSEFNPALGLRSLRLSLREPELFRIQLRAILRASALGDVRVMFPLVTTLTEFRRARAILNEVAKELTAEGIPIGKNLPVGVMVEVPAAAILADQLAKEVDFFSIGTNDLIQYTLAVDRTNEAVADLYSAADPGVLRLIAMVVDAAKPRNLDVCVCGTMGGDPLYAMLLLGLGVRQLSMPPHQLPEIKRVIRGIRACEAREIAAQALQLETSEAVIELLQKALQTALPDTPTIGTPGPIETGADRR